MAFAEHHSRLAERAVFATFLLVIVGTSHAQGPPSGKDRLAWKLSYSNWGLDEAEVEDGDGSFSVNRQRFSAGWSRLSMTYQRWDFDWSNVVALPFGDGLHAPWTSIESVRLSGRLMHHLGGPWSAVGGISAGCTYESDTSDAFSASIFGGVGYALNPGTILRMGGLVSYHPIRTVVWPMIGFDLRTRSGFSATLGFPKTEARWRFSPEWEVSISALADRALARLADDSVVERNGYLDSTNYMGALGVTFRPSKNWEIDLRWAQSMSRSVRFYDENGHKTGDFDVGSAPGVLVGVSYRF